MLGVPKRENPCSLFFFLFSPFFLLEGQGTVIAMHPVLPFLDLSVLPRKTLKLTKDFCPLPNPLKPRKNQTKHRNNQGNSFLKINQGIPKEKVMKLRTS